jgi:hypothetical protein
MCKEKQLTEKFQIEELENRFEMGQWVGSVKVGADYEGYGAAVTFQV